MRCTLHDRIPAIVTSLVDYCAVVGGGTQQNGQQLREYTVAAGIRGRAYWVQQVRTWFSLTE